VRMHHATLRSMRAASADYAKRDPVINLDRRASSCCCNCCGRSKIASEPVTSASTPDVLHRRERILEAHRAGLYSRVRAGFGDLGLRVALCGGFNRKGVISRCLSQSSQTMRDSGVDSELSRAKSLMPSRAADGRECVVVQSVGELISTPGCHAPSRDHLAEILGCFSSRGSKT